MLNWLRMLLKPTAMTHRFHPKTSIKTKENLVRVPAQSQKLN